MHKALRRALFLCLLIAAAAIVSVLNSVMPPRPVIPDAERISDARYWESVIAEAGSHSAYDAYLAASQPLNVGRQHVVAHAFARALYAKHGAAALEMCGDEYIAGCVHEVTARIFHDTPDRMELAHDCRIQQENEQSFFDRACAHGIGHGLMAEAGYTSEGLSRAMTECEALGLTEANGACTYGVIMEWYFRYMSEQPQLYPEDPDAEGLCRSFSDRARESCFYNISAIWMAELDPDRESRDETYVRVGARCIELTDPGTDRINCILGVGRLIATRRDGASDSRLGLCDLAFSQEDGRSLCRDSVAYVESIR